jgi:hypothetical protein
MAQVVKHPEFKLQYHKKGRREERKEGGREREGEKERKIC